MLQLRKKIKVLQINVTYNEGSTGKIVYDLHNELKDSGFESIVCYGRGRRQSGAGIYKTSSEIEAKTTNLMSRFSGQYNGALFATPILIQTIKWKKPEIVHVSFCLWACGDNLYKIFER